MQVWHEDMQIRGIRIAHGHWIVQPSHQSHLSRRHEMLQQDVMRLCHRLLLLCGDFTHDDEAAIALRTGGVPTDHAPLSTLALRIAAIEDKVYILRLAYPQVSGDDLTA